MDRDRSKVATRQWQGSQALVQELRCCDGQEESEGHSARNSKPKAMPRSCIGSLRAVWHTLLPDETPANDTSISALDVHNFVSAKEVGNTLNTNQAQLLDVLRALQARHDQLDMKLDTISQSSFTSHPSLRSTASAPLSASRLTIDNGNVDRDSHDFVSWKLPAWSDNGSFSDQRSQASGTSQHGAQAPRGRRTSLRGSPRPSTPFRRRSPSQDQHLHDLQESADTTGDQTPDHDSHWTDERLEDGRPLLQRHYWDAAMLCQWTDGRDRINKWMLHSLGVDVKQAAVHQKAIESELGSLGLSVDEVLVAGGSWERLAFQYWLIDEAALGVNMLQPPEADTIPSLGPPSLRTDRSSQNTFSASRSPGQVTELPRRPLGESFASEGATITPPGTPDHPDDGRLMSSWSQNPKELQEAVRAIQPKRAGSPALGIKPLHTGIVQHMTTVPAQREIAWVNSIAWSNSDTSESDGYFRPPPMHVRKQSGELVKSALRPARGRRRYSMPGTPTYSKSVHYAESNRVRHFMQVDRHIAISAGTSPVEQNESETEFPFGSPPRKTSGDVSSQASVAAPKTRYDFSPALRAPIDAAEKILGAEKLDTSAVILKKPTPSPSRESAPPTVDVSLDTAQPALDSQEYKDFIEKYCFFGSAKRTKTLETAGQCFDVRQLPSSHTMAAHISSSAVPRTACKVTTAPPADPPLCVAAVDDGCVVALVAEPDREGAQDVARDVAGLVLEAGTASNEVDDVDLAAAAADAPTAPERVAEVEGAAVAEGVPVPVWTWPLGAV
ncbi:hypothetical protein LTR95_004510 [Oleoguttula sp. CCFEE 5521]